MEIKAVIELLKELGMLAIPAAKEQDDLIGKRVLVRTYSAGVHIGTLVKRDGMECRLTNAVRLWKWEGGGLSVLGGFSSPPRPRGKISLAALATREHGGPEGGKIHL